MLHILMVDDEPDLDMLIQQRFRRAVKAGDIKLSFARNGLLALKSLSEQKKTTPIDLVISDLNMPEMNGLELLLKANFLYPQVKFYIISAYSDQESIQKAKNSGAKGFLVKPLNFKELDEIIDKEKNNL